MPSWNIHIAHVERLAETADLHAWGVSDYDAFLFGNIAPDVYVGYMVSDPTYRLPYKLTHLTEAHFIPKPDAAGFYERFLAGRDVSDVVLGAWCHLLCDHYYNKMTIEYIDAIGVQPGDEVRKAKQGDFDVFGRTLDIRSVPRLTRDLLGQCRGFCHYEILGDDVVASIASCEAIVDRNVRDHVDAPSYQLLTKDFFDTTFREVDEVLRQALSLRAAGEDPTTLGRA